MVDSRMSSPYQRFVVASLALLLAFTVSSCGSGSEPQETKAELKAQLSKLPKLHQDDFRAGDTNHDLRLQDSELDAMLEEDFKASDLDKDGEITEADFRQEFGKDVDVEASLMQIDANHDGRVPLEEYAAHVERDFMRDMDTNKDGHIDPSEAVAFYEAPNRPKDAQ